VHYLDKKLCSFAPSQIDMKNTKLMLKVLSAAVLTVAMFMHSGCAENSKKPVKFKLKTEVDSVSYALGAQLGASIAKDGLDTVLVMKQFIAGLRNGMLGDTSMSEEQKMQIIQGFFEKEMQKQTSGLKDASDMFFEENGQKPGVVTTASGLQYEVVSEGTGPKPTASSVVRVHYKGTLTDGEVFDSSEGMDPVEFPLNQVITGWTEGIQLMSVGSKYKFYIPYYLGYGEQGSPQGVIGPFETLIFEVELLAIVK
jgi:FKBP-type peptidyl-prolyl cis-trans isomerase